MSGLIERFSSRVQNLQFKLRDRHLGKVQFRRALPLPRTNANERAFYGLLLTRAFAPAEAEKVTVAWDVGCRNWSYAEAMADAFPNASLVGVEVDARRRYWNLYRRQDFAEAMAAQLTLEGQPARCVFGDFRDVDLELRADDTAAFCFFYPFVSNRPCLKWGLPVDYADFGSILAHVPQGALIASFHQGEWEAEIARKAYADLGLLAGEQVIAASEYQGLWPSSYDVHVLKARG